MGSPKESYSVFLSCFPIHLNIIKSRLVSLKKKMTKDIMFFVVDDV